MFSYHVLVVTMARIGYFPDPRNKYPEGLPRSEKVRIMKPQVYSKRWDLGVLCAISSSV